MATSFKILADLSLIYVATIRCCTILKYDSVVKQTTRNITDIDNWIDNKSDIIVICIICYWLVWIYIRGLLKRLKNYNLFEKGGVPSCSESVRLECLKHWSFCGLVLLLWLRKSAKEISKFSLVDYLYFYMKYINSSCVLLKSKR